MNYIFWRQRVKIFIKFSNYRPYVMSATDKSYINIIKILYEYLEYYSLYHFKLIPDYISWIVDHKILFNLQMHRKDLIRMFTCIQADGAIVSSEELRSLPKHHENSWVQGAPKIWSTQFWNGANNRFRNVHHHGRLHCKTWQSVISKSARKSFGIAKSTAEGYIRRLDLIF